MTEKTDTATDWWGFVAACKSAVHDALQYEKFNHANRAARVAVKAVLKLVSADGVQLDRLYDDMIGKVRRHDRYLLPFAPVCSAIGKGTVHDDDFNLIDTFDIVLTWSKDVRESELSEAERKTYIENLLYARAMLIMAERKATSKYPKGAQVCIESDWRELKENTRSLQQ